jgi:hypothetical protein
MSFDQAKTLLITKSTTTTAISLTIVLMVCGVNKLDIGIGFLVI